ncbi:MAG: glycosyltransferase [Aestuariivirga sp.]
MNEGLNSGSGIDGPALCPARNGTEAAADKTSQHSEPYSAKDITAVISIRLHASNTWLLERLRFFSNHYAPRPAVIVVDFGSEPEYSARIRDVCLEGGLRYVFVDDRGVYSNARARNIGVGLASTDLVFLSDLDFVFSHGFFAQLAGIAGRVGMQRYVDVVLMCAAYHLTESATKHVAALESPAKISERLDYIAYHAVFEGRQGNVEFIAPYSNVFLMRRCCFDLTGGYDETFRGHGSEDFEYFVRLSRYSSAIPPPADVALDECGPLTAGFFGPKRYRGFRVVNSIVALPGLLSGLRAFHLHHPKMAADAWYKTNDWKRVRLKEVVDKYWGRPHHLLRIDAMARPNRVLCICLNPNHWGYFVPLRAAGYQIVPVFSDSSDAIEQARKAILDCTVDAVAIFNPYMKSHSRFLDVVRLARARLRTIVIERGALPATLYYAPDVAYADRSFSEVEFAAFEMSLDERRETLTYFETLRSGESTLEQSEKYETTARRHGASASRPQAVCFIPLQMSEDMAVTMFLRESQTYDDFVQSIDRVASSNPDITFIVKNHPLSKHDVDLKAPNVVIAERSDNIHALIDVSTFTVCYNSGVGLISLVHGRPTYTIGNAYYNRGGAGRFCNSLEEAVYRHRNDPHAPDADCVVRLVTWLRRHRYSVFTATDDIREHADRRSHGYREVTVTRLVLDGKAHELGRAAAAHPFSERSYGMGLLGLSLKGEDVVAAKDHELRTQGQQSSGRQYAAPGLLVRTLQLFMPRKYARKLEASPDRFFHDAKTPVTRAIGWLLRVRVERQQGYGSKES